ncbi:MAG: hypothetical protein NC910_01485 [Candidatus Omnitrophica bacterium]|nr:hypothetical protein [Candidatus Omnitrophota bacterium]
MKRPVLLALAVALWAVCRFLVPAGMPLLLAGLGFVLTRRACRAFLLDPSSERVVLASYVVKTTASFLLYGISLFSLPVLQSLQLGNGFWSIAWDGVAYHQYAQVMRQALLHLDFSAVQALRLPAGTISMSGYLGGIYLLAGSTPLNGILLNSWWATAGLIAAFLLAVQLRIPSGSIPTILLPIAFWPSAILWSTQLLKDVIILSLVLITCALFLFLWHPGEEERRMNRMGWLFLTLSVLLLSTFRNYTSLILASCIFLDFLFFAVWKSKTYGPRALLRGAGLTAIILTCSISGSAIVIREIGMGMKEKSIAGLSQRLPEYAGELRRGLMKTPGSALVAPDQPPAQISYRAADISRNLAAAFFAPFPWQWKKEGNWSLMRVAAGLEALLIYPLVIGLLISLPRFSVLQEGQGFFLLLFVIVLPTTLSAVIPNFGSMARLRLQFILPMILLLGKLRMASSNS